MGLSRLYLLLIQVKLRASILLIISCVINGFLARFSTLPTKSLILSNTHSFIFFHCTSAFSLSHSIAPSYSCRVSCMLCLCAYSFSKSYLGLLLGNLKFSSTWCGLRQPVSCGHSPYLPQAVSAHPSHCFSIDA